LSPELLEAVFGVKPLVMSSPRYNIAPTQQVSVVRDNENHGREWAEMRWGLVPHWAKDLSIGNRLINARCETVAEKPSFRSAIRHRRCIVAASGFYEWKVTSKGKFPHYVTMTDEAPVAFAGIWESWKDAEGVALESCALLTTAANSLMETIHDRMPVILQQSDFEEWLDRSVTDTQKIQRIYQPYPAELMQEWPVSTFVNNPSQIGEECIHRVT
jgi:putative SOS response-associated peptidase YedK